MLAISPQMPLPNRALFVSGDIDAARAHLSRRFWPHSVTPLATDAPFAFRHHQAAFAQTSFNALRYGTAVAIDSQPSDPSYLVKFTLDGTSEVAQGRAVVASGAGMVCVMNPTGRLRVRLSADHNQLTLRVPGSVVHACIEREFGTVVRQPLEFEATARQVAECAPGLGRLVGTLCEDLDAPAAGFRHPRVAGHLEQTLVGLLLTELPHNYSAMLAAPVATATPACVVLAEDYIRAHAREPLGIADIAAATGVSVRSLQAGFRRHRGTNPMRFLRDCRLALAREALLAGQGDVTGVAVACGFGDPGKFAAHFRARYGEPPSAALQRGRLGKRR